MLEVLFPEIDTRTFLENHWPKIPFWTRSSALPDYLLTGWSARLSVEHLLSTRRRPVHVWSNEGSRLCNAEEALVLHQSGHALYIPRVDEEHAELAGHIRSLEQDLGVPAGSGHCSVFAAKAGAVVQPHCDHDYGFNINIKGRKRWSISCEQTVAFPLTGHQLGRQSAPLASSASQILPAGMPPASHFLTTRGSAVFLPAGVWHSTVAETDSLSLDFAIDPPRRSRYVAESVEQLLNSHPSFRAPLDRTASEWIDSVGRSVAGRLTECLTTSTVKPVYVPLSDGALILIESGDIENSCSAFVYAENIQIASFRVFGALVPGLLKHLNRTTRILTAADVVEFIRRPYQDRSGEDSCAAGK